MQPAPRRLTIGSNPGLAWMLLAALSSLPFLVPTGAKPYPEFNRDALQAVVWCTAMLVFTWRFKGRWDLPAPAAAIFVAASIPAVQGMAGLQAYPAEGAWATLYLAGLAAAVAAGATAERTAPLRLADAMFAGIVVASLASVGLALAQWLRLDPVGVLLHAGPPGGQPSANLGQPNLLATLLLWGVVGIWWSRWRGRLGAAVASLAVVFLLGGVLLTQSRTGLIGAAVLGLFATAAPRQSGLRPSRLMLSLLALAMALMALAGTWLSSMLDFDVARSLADAANPGKRPLIWATMLDAVAARPWFGYGWNQGFAAHVAVAARHAALHVPTQHAHNFVLDMLVWNGVPLGALLSVLVAGWFGWRLVGMNGDAPQHLLMAALSVFALHAMLELPHTVALMMVPVALMVGAVETRARPSAMLHLPRVLAAAVLSLLLVALVQWMLEYRRVEADLMAQRIRSARIGDLTPPPPLELHLMRPLQDALQAQRVEVREGMAVGDIDALQRSALRYPAAGALFRAAQAAALNGRAERAREFLALLCSLHPRTTCERARMEWQEVGSSQQGMMSIGSW